MTDETKPEVCIATSVCPEPTLWKCYDDQATEVEVLACLRSLVAMLKPKRIVETGCYHGYGTEQLARGCYDNGFGVVYTCDLDHQCVETTRNRLVAAGLHPRVVLYQMKGTEMLKDALDPIDFAFLDSGPDENRCDELRLVYPKMSEGGVVAVHDTGPHGFLREKFLPPLLRELGMQYIYFDTPRGITLCRKQPSIYP